jgi:hypothetical protein
MRIADIHLTYELKPQTEIISYKKRRSIKEMKRLNVNFFIEFLHSDLHLIQHNLALSKTDVCFLS